MKSAATKKQPDRSEYKKERNRYLMAWEAPSLEFKARCYHAADMNRISFNSWFAAFVFESIEKVLDKQRVPNDPNFLFQALAKSRPNERIWTEILEGKQAVHPPQVRRRNARRI